MLLEMESVNISPNVVVYRSLINGWISGKKLQEYSTTWLDTLDDAEKVFKSIADKGIANTDD
ncbi:hypothetical protein ACSBR2_031005 [Camellia fascicularis]